MKQKLYLTAIIDLYDRSIVSYSISYRNDNNLVYRTFEKAKEVNPEATPLLHSDRGYQYTSKVFKKMLEGSEIIQSMSRVGRCIDNGPIKGLWGIIKAEMYYLNEFHTIEELKSSLEKYIKFYNHDRPQGRYSDQTPIEVNKRIETYYQSFKSE